MATINTRIKLRYDQYANWVAKDPVLYAGEVAVAVAPAEAGTGLHEPCVTMKVGDGTSKYSELSFITALAGDVLTACKTTEGLTKFINDVLVDAGVLNGGEAGDGKSLAERVTDAEGAIDALKKADEEIRAEIAAKISTAYKASGSVSDVAGLPALTEANLGNVYHVSADFETTADFLEGAGKKVPAGSNVVVVEKTPAVKNEEGAVTTPATYAYDVVGSFIDLSDYYTKEETDALIPKAVEEALTPTTNPDDPTAEPEKSPLLQKVEEIVDSAINELDYADAGTGFVTAVTQENGLIAVVKKAIQTGDVVGLEKEIQTVITESLTKPVDPVDPENPTDDEKAAQELYQKILEEVTKLVNEALGADGENGKDGLTGTITNIVEKEILDEGKPEVPADPDNGVEGSPAVPASPVNEAVKIVIGKELDKLDYTNDAEGVVTSVSQTDGLIAVVKKVLAAADISDFTKVVKETIASAVKEPTQVEDPDNPGSMLPVNPTDEATYDAIVDAVVKIVMEELSKKTVTGEGGTGTEEVPVNQEFYDKIREIVSEMVAEAIVNGKDGADGKDGITTVITKTINDALKDEGGEPVNPDDPDGEKTPASELNQTVNNMIDTKINALDVEDTAVEDSVVATVSQTDGKVSNTKVKLAKVAFTGRFADLIQEEESDPGYEEIVLGGGGA